MPQPRTRVELGSVPKVEGAGGLQYPPSQQSSLQRPTPTSCRWVLPWEQGFILIEARAQPPYAWGRRKVPIPKAHSSQDPHSCSGRAQPPSVPFQPPPTASSGQFWAPALLFVPGLGEERQAGARVTFSWAFEAPRRRLGLGRGGGGDAGGPGTLGLAR